MGAEERVTFVSMTLQSLILVFACTATGAFGFGGIPTQQELLVQRMHQLAGSETIESMRADASGLEFLSVLESDNQWLHMVLDSGPVHNGDVVLGFLRDRWVDDPSLSETVVEQSMTTACALAMGMRELDPEWMHQRLDWFLAAWKDDRLNSGFGDLTTFERRFLARGLQRTRWTTAEALEYLQSQVCLPRAMYAKAAWRAPYRGHSAFGDTVQGPMYYMPFRDVFGSDAEMAIEVGGVCGSLSHVGAAAAIASGIPALTMGEPGHCAYAVHTTPHEWAPAYSLHWKRSIHTTMSRATWPSLVLSQLAHDNVQQASEAGDLLRRARWFDTHDQVADADSAFRSACRANPYDESIWQARAAFGVRRDRPGAWWTAVATELMAALMPDHPEPCWVLLRKHVLPSMSPARKRSTWFRWARLLSGWGPSQWNIEAAFTWAWKHAVDGTSPEAFLSDTLDAIIDDPAIGGVFVVWAQDTIASDATLARWFEHSLLARVTEGVASGEEGSDAVLRHMARRMLPLAADSHDLETFQRIGRAAASLSAPRTSLEDMNVEPFPGVLLSSGGALRIFKPGNRWDSPESHWGVLEERGGWFHTQTGEAPWFEIELPGFGELTGIVLDSRKGQPGPVKGVRVLVSQDGESWSQVGHTTTGKPIQRIDLQDSLPRARFVRFERDGKCLHYHRVLIYGRRAS